MVEFVYSEKRSIEIPNGLILEVEMTRTFIKMLMVRFNLSSEDELTDDLLREFMYGSLNSFETGKNEL